jgi:hypothetical protein
MIKRKIPELPAVDVASATGEEIAFEDGTVLKKGDMVKLPAIAGSAMGLVDDIVMVFNEKTLEATIELIVVSETNGRYVFQFPAKGD